MANAGMLKKTTVKSFEGLNLNKGFWPLLLRDPREFAPESVLLEDVLFFGLAVGRDFPAKSDAELTAAVPAVAKVVCLLGARADVAVVDGVELIACEMPTLPAAIIDLAIRFPPGMLFHHFGHCSILQRGLPDIAWFAKPMCFNLPFLLCIIIGQSDVVS